MDATDVLRTEAAATDSRPSLEVVRDPESAAAMLDPQRRRLLEALAEEPDSASGLARRLDDTRQRLNYHLRALEDAGLIEIQEERRRGNFTERVMRVVARRFVVDPAAFGFLGADPADSAEAGDRFSATYLIALAQRAIRELAGLREEARRQEKRLATAGLAAEVRLARPSDFEAFVEDLSEAIAAVVARHHDEGARSRPFRIFASAYPAKDRKAGKAEKRQATEP